MGEGNPRDIGIRFLIFLVGSLVGIVAYYLRKDLKRVLDTMEGNKNSIKNIDDNARKMDDSFKEYKEKLSELLNYYMAEFRKEIFELKVNLNDFGGKLTKNTLELESYQGLLKHQAASVRSDIVLLEHRIDETIKHLKDSHESREEVYGLIRDLRRLEEKHEQTFGKIIHLESRWDRYNVILNGLEKTLLAKKNKPETK